MKLVAKSISRLEKCVRRERHATRRASQQPSLHCDDDRRRDILRARPARTGAPDRLLLLRRCARLLLAMHLPGRKVPWARGRQRQRASRRWCDGRWECLVKPANCYRFIGTHGVHVPERKEDHRGRSSVTVDGSRETEWTISNYGNFLFGSHFVISQ